MNHRYERDVRSELPGYRPILGPDEYTYRPPEVRITGVHLTAAAGCYEYQSCEHDGWPQSHAFALMGQLGGKVPAFDAIAIDHELAEKPGLPPDRGPWGFDEEHVHPPASEVSR